MKNFWLLTISSLKQLFRNKEAIFWSLVFPLIFILIFQLFNFEGSVGANILVLDRADTEISRNIVGTLQDIKGIGINESFAEVEPARSALTNSETQEFTFIDEETKEEITKEEKVNMVIVIPEHYGDLALQGEEFELQVYYNQASEGQTSPSGIVTSIIEDITTGIVLQSNGITNPFAINREGVAVNDIRYYDILVPGILAMSIMQSGIIGMASGIANLKEKRILKRLSATPLPIWQFILSQVITFLILSLIQVTVTVVFSKYILGANIYGSIPLIYVLAILGNFVFLNIGFITGALSKTANGAASLAQVFVTPMMFLSGVFFERSTLPDVVRSIADLLPLSPLIDALRDVSLQNGSLADQSQELLLIAVWTLITFLIAAKLFKFREE